MKTWLALEGKDENNGFPPSAFFCQGCENRMAIGLERKSFFPLEISICLFWSQRVFLWQKSVGHFFPQTAEKGFTKDVFEKYTRPNFALKVSRAPLSLRRSASLQASLHCRWSARHPEWCRPRRRGPDLHDIWGVPFRPVLYFIRRSVKKSSIFILIFILVLYFIRKSV